MAASLNQTIYGQINGAYSPDRWTFSALAKQQIRFNLVATGSPSLKFDLTGPNGYVGFTGLSASSDLLTLSTSGTYTLAATGFSGAYAFRLDQTSLTDLTPGVTYQGSLAGTPRLNFSGSRCRKQPSCSSGCTTTVRATMTRSMPSSGRRPLALIINTAPQTLPPRISRCLCSRPQHGGKVSGAVLIIRASGWRSELGIDLVMVAPDCCGATR